MDEILTSVNAEQVSDEGSQQMETVTGESNAEVAEQQTGVQSAEDNARYASIRREAEQKAREKARDELIAEMYGDHGISTYAEYQRALEEANRQEELERLVQSNIPEQYAQEMIENRKFREQYQAQMKEQEQKTQQEKMYQDFLEAYPEFNDTTKANEIPQEVWSKVKEGKNLTDAYNEHLVKEYKKQLEALNAKEEAAKANQANAQTSTGSVKSEGTPSVGYISKDVFEANKNNQKWMYEHFDEIKKSMGKWK